MSKPYSLSNAFDELGINSGVGMYENARTMVKWQRHHGKNRKFKVKESDKINFYNPHNQHEMSKEKVYIIQSMRWT